MSVFRKKAGPEGGAALPQEEQALSLEQLDAVTGGVVHDVGHGTVIIGNDPTDTSGGDPVTVPDAAKVGDVLALNGFNGTLQPKLNVPGNGKTVIELVKNAEKESGLL